MMSLLTCHCPNCEEMAKRLEAAEQVLTDSAVQAGENVAELIVLRQRAEGAEKVVVAVQEYLLGGKHWRLVIDALRAWQLGDPQ